MAKLWLSCVKLMATEGKVRESKYIITVETKMNKMMRLFLKDGKVIWVRETISTFLVIFIITITSITSIVTKSMRKPHKKSQKAKQMIKQ